MLLVFLARYSFLGVELVDLAILFLMLFRNHLIDSYYLLRQPLQLLELVGLDALFWHHFLGFLFVWLQRLWCVIKLTWFLVWSPTTMHVFTLSDKLVGRALRVRL